MLSDDELLGAVAKSAQGGASVMLINSHAEGFGNSVSDIDLMVVLDEPGEATRNYWESAFVRGQRLDVNYIDRAVVLQRLGALSVLPLTGAVIDFGHKMRSARPLLGAGNHMHTLATVNWQRFDERLSAHYLVDAHLRMEDIYGSVQEAEHQNAVLNARVLLNESLDACLALRGESQPRGKWRLKKARRAMGATNPVVAAYLECMLLGAPVHGDCLHVLTQTLDVVRFLQCKTLLRLPDCILEDQRVRMKHALSHPVFSCASWGTDALIAHNPSPRMRLGVTEAFVWLMAPYFASTAELHETLRCCESEELCPYRPRSLSEVDVQRMLDSLTAKSLLVTSPIE